MLWDSEIFSCGSSGKLPTWVALVFQSYINMIIKAESLELCPDQKGIFWRTENTRLSLGEFEVRAIFESPVNEVIPGPFGVDVQML